TFDRSLAALRPRGMLVLYGAASGRVPPFDPMELERGGSLYLTRPSLRHYATAERAREVYDLIGAGKLDVRIGGRYPLADARRAPARKPASSRSGMISVSPTGSPSKRSTASRALPPRRLTSSTRAASAMRSQPSSGSRSGTSERPPRSTNNAGSPPSSTTCAP